MIEWGQERLWEQRSIGHDCMIEYYGVYYTMSDDRLLHGCISGVHATKHCRKQYQYMSTPVQQYCYSVP
jgi:hypothetical protein